MGGGLSKASWLHYADNEEAALNATQNTLEDVVNMFHQLQTDEVHDITRAVHWARQDDVIGRLLCQLDIDIGVKCKRPITRLEDAFERDDIMTTRHLLPIRNFHTELLINGTSPKICRNISRWQAMTAGAEDCMIMIDELDPPRSMEFMAMYHRRVRELDFARSRRLLRRVIDLFGGAGAFTMHTAVEDADPFTYVLDCLTCRSRLNELDWVKEKGKTRWATCSRIVLTAARHHRAACVRRMARIGFNLLYEPGLASWPILFARWKIHPERQRPDGTRAIHHAGSAEIVRTLIQDGADPHERIGPTMVSPLEMAVMADRGDVVEALIDGGVDVNAASIMGITALHQAAKHAPGLVDLLLKRGANPTLRDENGYRPADVSSDVLVRRKLNRITKEYCRKHHIKLDNRQPTRVQFGPDGMVIERRLGNGDGEEDGPEGKNWAPDVTAGLRMV